MNTTYAGDLSKTFPQIFAEEYAAMDDYVQQLYDITESASLKDPADTRSEAERDTERYRWLRAAYAAGRETYLAEGICSKEQLDHYIDCAISHAKGNHDRHPETHP